MSGSKTRRRSLRRHVGVICSIGSQLWDGSVEFAASDVSHEGLWIDTPYPLELGDEVVLSFVPPGARHDENVWAVAEVARVGLWDANCVPWEAGMGLSFTYFSQLDRRFLARSLLHRPPRLPRKPRVPAPMSTQPPPLPASEPMLSKRALCLGTPARARPAAIARTRVSSSADFGLSEMPPVIDPELASLELTPTCLGDLLTSGASPAARRSAWGLV